MVCPYKVAVAALTVVCAALIAFAVNNDTQKPGAFDPDGKRKWLKWLDLSQYKDTKLYKMGYFFGVVMLVLFHLELFSGGFICKQLFAKVPEQPCAVSEITA
eukprot:m.155904 g.155904  ORF g.155904 m.155904 type:complete len:102 (+) comp52923_c0_seq2:254-559(+)